MRLAIREKETLSCLHLQNITPAVCVKFTFQNVEHFVFILMHVRRRLVSWGGKIVEDRQLPIAVMGFNQIVQLEAELINSCFGSHFTNKAVTIFLHDFDTRD